MFREVSTLTRSRIDALKSGQFVIRHGRTTGYLSRITAEHELLHMAQFVRDPYLARRVRQFGFFHRQLYEIVPGFVGSPAIHGTAMAIALSIGGGLGYLIIK